MQKVVYMAILLYNNVVKWPIIFKKIEKIINYCLTNFTKYAII